MGVHRAIDAAVQARRMAFVESLLSAIPLTGNGKDFRKLEGIQVIDFTLPG